MRSKPTKYEVRHIAVFLSFPSCAFSLTVTFTQLDSLQLSTPVDVLSDSVLFIPVSHTSKARQTQRGMEPRATRSAQVTAH
jgi:hypothetical protein